MFLLYDGLPFQTGSRVRGIGRYAAGLLDGLRAVRPGWDVRIIEHGSLPPLGPELAARFPVRRFDYPVPYRRGTAAALQRYFADWVAAQRPDWVLHPSPFETAGAVPRYSAPRPRTAAVLYDLIPALFPDHYLKHDPATIDGYAARLRMTAGYDLLLAISQATADDAARVLGPGGRTVVNIRGAADDRFDSPPPDRRAAVEAAVRARYGLARPFILYVGAGEWRKNMAGAVEGYAALPAAVRSGVDLVLACRLAPDVAAGLTALAARLGAADGLKLTQYVPDEDSVALYAACRVFFFPSLYEGLGLPVVEAMRCGAGGDGRRLVAARVRRPRGVVLRPDIAAVDGRLRCNGRWRSRRRSGKRNAAATPPGSPGRTRPSGRPAPWSGRCPPPPPRGAGAWPGSARPRPRRLRAWPTASRSNGWPAKTRVILSPPLSKGGRGG